jgi:hypothetical protein
MNQALPPSAVDAGRGGLLERRSYLIDRFPVSFQGGSSWHCHCREFASANSCRHTREAAGMREAQDAIRARATHPVTTLERVLPRAAPPVVRTVVYASVQTDPPASRILAA